MLPLIACHSLTETVRYYLMHDHAILRDIFFGAYRQNQLFLKDLPSIS